MDDRTQPDASALQHRSSDGRPLRERLRSRRKLRVRGRTSRALIAGAVLTVASLIWWAVTYPGVASTAGIPFADTIQCLPFRNAYCTELIESSGLRFPYSHQVLWIGLILVMVGLWRSSSASRDPSKFILRTRIAIFRVFALGILLLLWLEASRVIGVRFPTPYASFLAAGDLLSDPNHRLRTAFFESLNVYLRGLGYAAAVGIPVGLMLGGFKILGRTMDVFVNAIMATPRVAFIPLIIFFLSIGPEAKIFIIFLGAVMPIIANTYAGVRASDGELVEMARSVGARRSQIFVRILLPGALPFIIVGLRVGATIGLINTVVAELYTAATGLGGLLQRLRSTFQMDDYVVVVLCLTLIGVIVTSLLRVLESRTDRWRYDGS